MICYYCFSTHCVYMYIDVAFFEDTHIFTSSFPAPFYRSISDRWSKWLIFYPNVLFYFGSIYHVWWISYCIMQRLHVPHIILILFIIFITYRNSSSFHAFVSNISYIPILKHLQESFTYSGCRHTIWLVKWQTYNLIMHGHLCNLLRNWTVIS